MRTGNLRHLIAVTNPTITTQNSYGEDAVSNAAVGTYHCNVRPLSGSESEILDQRVGQALYQIIMRRQPGTVFTTKMKITWQSANGNIALDILDLQDPAESNPWITILARKVEGVS